MPHQASSDASFYALVHFVLEARQQAAQLDRRNDQRHDFATLQYVAPYHNGQLPTDDQFIQVVCRDISPQGLSFLSPSPPSTDYMVVALGSNSPIFLSASVLRHQPIVVDGQTLFLVGLRFIARIQPPDFNPQLGPPSPYAAALLSG